MALPVRAIIDWILSLGWDAAQETGAPLHRGPYIRDMPDKIVTITATGGPGYVMEAAADAGTFQARVRGGQLDAAGAEALAFQLDALILGASFPAVIDGRVIIHVHRLGGPPAPLAAGPDSGDRTELVCTYVAIAGT